MIIIAGHLQFGPILRIQILLLFITSTLAENTILVTTERRVRNKLIHDDTRIEGGTRNTKHDHSDCMPAFTYVKNNKIKPVIRSTPTEIHHRIKRCGNSMARKNKLMEILSSRKLPSQQRTEEDNSEEWIGTSSSTENIWRSAMYYAVKNVKKGSFSESKRNKNITDLTLTTSSTIRENFHNNPSNSVTDTELKTYPRKIITPTSKKTNNLNSKAMIKLNLSKLLTFGKNNLSNNLIETSQDKSFKAELTSLPSSKLTTLIDETSVTQQTNASVASPTPILDSKNASDANQFASDLKNFVYDELSSDMHQKPSELTFKQEPKFRNVFMPQDLKLSQDVLTRDLNLFTIPHLQNENEFLSDMTVSNELLRAKLDKNESKSALYYENLYSMAESNHNEENHRYLMSQLTSSTTSFPLGITKKLGHKIPSQEESSFIHTFPNASNYFRYEVNESNHKYNTNPIHAGNLQLPHKGELSTSLGDSTSVLFGIVNEHEDAKNVRTYLPQFLPSSSIKHFPRRMKSSADHKSNSLPLHSKYATNNIIQHDISVHPITKAKNYIDFARPIESTSLKQTKDEILFPYGGMISSTVHLHPHHQADVFEISQYSDYWPNTELPKMSKILNNLGLRPYTSTMTSLHTDDLSRLEVGERPNLKVVSTFNDAVMKKLTETTDAAPYSHVSNNLSTAIKYESVLDRTFARNLANEYNTFSYPLTNNETVWPENSITIQNGGNNNYSAPYDETVLKQNYGSDSSLLNLSDGQPKTSNGSMRNLTNFLDPESAHLIDETMYKFSPISPNLSTEYNQYNSATTNNEKLADDDTNATQIIAPHLLAEISPSRIIQTDDDREDDVRLEGENYPQTFITTTTAAVSSAGDNELFDDLPITSTNNRHLRPRRKNSMLASRFEPTATTETHFLTMNSGQPHRRKVKSSNNDAESESRDEVVMTYPKSKIKSIDLDSIPFLVKKRTNTGNRNDSSQTSETKSNGHRNNLHKSLHTEQHAFHSVPVNGDRKVNSLAGKSSKPSLELEFGSPLPSNESLPFSSLSDDEYANTEDDKRTPPTTNFVEKKVSSSSSSSSFQNERLPMNPNENWKHGANDTYYTIEQLKSLFQWQKKRNSTTKDDNFVNGGGSNEAAVQQRTYAVSNGSSRSSHETTTTRYDTQTRDRNASFSVKNATANHRDGAAKRRLEIFKIPVQNESHDSNDWTRMNSHPPAAIRRPDFENDPNKFSHLLVAKSPNECQLTKILEILSEIKAYILANEAAKFYDREKADGENAAIKLPNDGSNSTDDAFTTHFDVNDNLSDLHALTGQRSTTVGPASTSAMFSSADRDDRDDHDGHVETIDSSSFAGHHANEIWTKRLADCDKIVLIGGDGLPYWLKGTLDSVQPATATVPAAKSVDSVDWLADDDAAVSTSVDELNRQRGVHGRSAFRQPQRSSAADRMIKSQFSFVDPKIVDNFIDVYRRYAPRRQKRVKTRPRYRSGDAKTYDKMADNPETSEDNFMANVLRELFRLRSSVPAAFVDHYRRTYPS